MLVFDRFSYILLVFNFYNFLIIGFVIICLEEYIYFHETVLCVIKLINIGKIVRFDYMKDAYEIDHLWLNMICVILLVISLNSHVNKMLGAI